MKIAKCKLQNRRIAGLLHRIFLLVILICVGTRVAAEPLKVCCTVPDLGLLVKEVGGEEVAVMVFVKGTEDPHYLEARPSYIKELSGADLFVQVGLELEQGWVPVLLRGCRNDRVQPGAAGFLDASAAITPLDVPTGAVDRSQGDVHARGNPHYLLDPLNGLKVATLVTERLKQLRPDRGEYFAARLKDFENRLAVAMVGEPVAEAFGYDLPSMMLAWDADRFLPLLEQLKLTDQLGGWLGRLRAYGGEKFVADHRMWTYFAARFKLQAVGHMEPKPGVQPSTRHLAELIKQMKREKVRLIITGVYFDPRHAKLLADQTGAGIGVLAHQAQAVAEADTYIGMVEYNVARVTAALEAAK